MLFNMFGLKAEVLRRNRINYGPSAIAYFPDWFATIVPATPDEITTEVC